MRASSLFALASIAALTITPAVYAQRAPAIPGVTGTVATDATVKEEHKVANKIVVATEDGVKHVFPAGTGPLSDLKEGVIVVIHRGTEMTEGTAAKVANAELTVRYGNGKTDRLVLSKEPTTLVVEYKDESGRKIARYFKPKS